MKKTIALTMGLGLLLPIISFAEESAIKANVYVTASTSRPDNIRERLDEVKRKAEERKKEATKVMEDRYDKRASTTAEIMQKKESIKEEMENKREELKSKIEEKRDEFRDKTRENINDRLKNFLGKITERFSEAVHRLRKLNDRISSRIAKIEAGGGNMTEAKSLLAEASLKIEMAASSTALIKIKAEKFISSNTSVASSTDLKIFYQEVKNQVEQAKSDIKVAHAALVRVIVAIKPGLNKKPPTASTTRSIELDNDDN